MINQVESERGFDLPPASALCHSGCFKGKIKIKKNKKTNQLTKKENKRN
jgi:hypothetical protein